MKKFLICFLLLFLSFTLYGCDSKEEVISDDNINVEEKMNNVMKTDNYIIVDVRTADEYSEGHVVGAINIPYDQINENTDLDKSKTIMVYCRSGKRSGVAYSTLKDLGYDVLDLGAYESINLDKE